MTQTEVVNTLFDQGPRTREQLGLSPFRVNRLVAIGEVAPVKDQTIRDQFKTGDRGRPPHVFRLSDKARKRVKRQRAAAA